MVMDRLKDIYRPNMIFVSVVAGVSIDILTKRLEQENSQIIRLMPNVPSVIGKGAGAFACSESVTPQEKAFIEDVLKEMGQFFEVDEVKLHAVTALSGSGPALVSVLFESFVDAGVRCGLDNALSYDLAHATIKGTLDYIKLKKISPSQLKKEVTLSWGYHSRRIICA